MALEKLRESLKKDNVDPVTKKIINEIKQSSISSSTLLKKELNDLEKGITNVNANLEKIFKALTNSPLVKNNKPGQSSPAMTNKGEIVYVTNPQDRRLLRQTIGNQPLNFRDVFTSFASKDQKNRSYLFQSGEQARAREDLKIKLAKNQITKNEFDLENEKIGTTAGLNPINFIKDFGEGLKDIFNFFTNKNKLMVETNGDSDRTEKTITERKLKLSDLTNSDVVDKGISIKLLTEVIKIRKILEKRDRPTTTRTRLNRPEIIDIGKENLLELPYNSRRLESNKKQEVKITRLRPDFTQKNIPGYTGGQMQGNIKGIYNSRRLENNKKQEVKITRLGPDFTQKNIPGYTGGQMQRNIKDIVQTKKEPPALPLLAGPNQSVVSKPSLPMEVTKKTDDIIDVEPKEVSETNINMGGAAGAVGASGAATAASKVSKFKNFIKGAGKVAMTGLRTVGKLALPVTAALGAMDATAGYMNATENLDIQNREATLGEKLSSAAGSAISGLSFGLLDSKDISKKIKEITGAGPDITPANLQENNLSSASQQNEELKRSSNGIGNMVVNNITQTSDNQSPIQAPSATPRGGLPSSLEQYIKTRASYGIA